MMAGIRLLKTNVITVVFTVCAVNTVMYLVMNKQAYLSSLKTTDAKDINTRDLLIQSGNLVTQSTLQTSESRPGSQSVGVDSIAYSLNLSSTLYTGHQQFMAPAFHFGGKNHSVFLAIGMPVAQRPNISYWELSLRSLFDRIRADSRNNCVVILMFSEPQKEQFIQASIETARIKFLEEVAIGLLEIIVPPANYYPSFEDIPLHTDTPPPGRKRWIAKQNLDFAYLMNYSKSKCKYYLQLEDDVLTSEDIVKVAQNDVKVTNNWLVLDYSRQGFIGKLFKSELLSEFTAILTTFYKDKPCDWLLIDYFFIKACKSDSEAHTMCQKYVGEVFPRKVNVFKHGGLLSSLVGKEQKVSGKFAGLFYPEPNKNQASKHQPLDLVVGAGNTNVNPPAIVSTSLKAYQSHTLDKVYLKTGIFWAEMPSEADYIRFDFTKPVNLKTYHFVSGSEQNPTDLIRNATLTLLTPGKPGVMSRPIAKFNINGSCSGLVPVHYHPTAGVLITFKSPSQYWVILKEVSLSLV